MSFSEDEFSLLRLTSTADDQPLILEFENEINALVKKFGESGQSGGSAPYVASAISDAVKRLCLHEPISPITGNELEWCEVGANTYQNKRCSALFVHIPKDPYYLDAIEWVTQDGYSYSGSAHTRSTGEIIRSRQHVKSFPFTPKTFRINVIEYEITPGDFEFVVTDDDLLLEVFEYYDRYN